MTTIIYIRTYSKDKEWLEFCIRSIKKYTRGFVSTCVAFPQGEEEQFKNLAVEGLVPVHDGQPGYLCQQVDKMHADIHCLVNPTTVCDQVLHVDSDCVFTQPVTPETFMRDGKPIWMWTPWEDMGAADKKSWFHVMCKCVQEAPPGEFMRRHPLLIPTWAYAAFRDFVQKTHGIPITQYIMNQPGREFSEFNCIGFYLWLYHHDKFSWWSTKEEGVPPKMLEQYWSWEPMHAGTRAWLNACLA